MFVCFAAQHDGGVKAKGNVAGVSRRRRAGESSSNTSDSPGSKKLSLRRTAQSSSEEHSDSVDVRLAQTDNTDSDSDVVVINKSCLSNTDMTKTQQRTVGDCHGSKRHVRSQNGVLDSDDNSEHDTIEGQLISSASDVDDSSEDAEVVFRGFPVESSSDVTSASSSRRNLRIIQLETELRQLKKSLRETVSKKVSTILHIVIKLFHETKKEFCYSEIIILSFSPTLTKAPFGRSFLYIF